jgi:hypothetical protein
MMKLHATMWGSTLLGTDGHGGGAPPGAGSSGHRASLGLGVV